MVSTSMSRPQRTPGTPQGIVLLCVAILPIMGVTLIAPVLPRMGQAFHTTPGADFLIPIALTIPALCIALCSPVIGLLADRFGRRRLLLGAAIFYAIFGIAPLVLTSLGAIIASRVGVGITEAALMTCSTTMLGDYFHGRDRGRWMAYQTAVASIAATLLFAIGGIMGERDWRTPFWLYASSLLVFAAVLFMTWEPAKSTLAQDVRGGESPWRQIGGIAALTVFGAIGFYVVPLQMGYVLGNLGITSSATIGIATAIGSCAVVAGTFIFARIADRPVPLLLAASFLLSGIGMLGLAHAADVRIAVASAFLNQLGCGLLLPTLLTWVMRKLPFELRGRGTGIFMMSFFAGQFISPIVLILAGKGLGGLLGAIQALAILCVVAALPFAVVSMRASHLMLVEEH